MKSNFSLLLAVFIHSLVLAQSGGYVGKSKILGVQANLYPIAPLFVPGNLNSSNDQSKSLEHLILQPRISYEHVLMKGFSISADFGFKNQQIGSEDQVSNEDIYTSNLFSDQQNMVSSGQGKFSKYYISGFDLKITSRFYYYKNRGKIAPIGNYFGIVIGLPNYKTYYKNDIVEKAGILSYGINLGTQQILIGKLAYDIGIRSSILFPLFAPISNSELDYDTSYESIPSNLYSTFSEIFDIYFKIAYLL